MGKLCLYAKNEKKFLSPAISIRSFSFFRFENEICERNRLCAAVLEISEVGK